MVDAKENNSAHKKKQQLYVAIALGSIAVAIGIFSLVYAYPLMLQRDLLDNNMPRKSALRIAVLTDANFTDKGWGESSLHAAQFIQQKYNNFTIATQDNVAIPDIEMTLEKYADSGSTADRLRICC